MRSRCKTCPFIRKVEKISGPKRSFKITDHFTCTSPSVIYCITCTYWKKLYVGETGRRPGDRFREHLRDVERNDKEASKPVARTSLVKKDLLKKDFALLRIKNDSLFREPGKKANCICSTINKRESFTFSFFLADFRSFLQLLCQHCPKIMNFASLLQ